MNTTMKAMGTFVDVWPVLRVIVIALIATAVLIMTPIMYNETARVRNDRKQEKLKILADDDNFFAELLNDFKSDPKSFLFKENGYINTLVKAKKYPARHKAA